MSRFKRRVIVGTISPSGTFMHLGDSIYGKDRHGSWRKVAVVRGGKREILLDPKYYNDDDLTMILHKERDITLWKQPITKGDK